MPNINVIGVVPNDAVAGQLVGNLRLAGFEQDDISVIIAKHEEAVDEAMTEDRRAEGLGSVGGKAAVGAAAGGVTGVLAAAGTVMLPGIGPVIGTGVLMAMFGGMGAAIGGLLGVYASERESTQVIERYGMALREGQAVVSVSTPDAETAKAAEEIFAANGAANINSYMQDESDVTDLPGIKDITE